MLWIDESNFLTGEILTVGSAGQVFAYQPGQKQHRVQRSIVCRNMLRLPRSVTNDHNDAANRLALNPTSVIFEENVFAKGACKAELLAFVYFPDTGYDRKDSLRTLHETVQ